MRVAPRALPLAEDAPPTASPLATWHARLALAFAVHGDGTTLVRRGSHGPLAVQRPFFPEGPKTCHVYLVHPPGGIVPGDALEIEVDTLPGAHGLLTTPAATKVYRSDGRRATLSQTLRAGSAAVLEWLPQETIVFDGARGELDTRVDLAPDATFLGWDIVCLGRRAAGERFQAGECRQSFELWCEGRPRLIERNSYQGEVLRAACGLRGASVLGLFVAASPPSATLDSDALLGELRGFPVSRGELLSATRVNQILVVRYLGHDLEHCRRSFERVWHTVRPLLVGRAACPPRIWST